MEQLNFSNGDIHPRLADQRLRRYQDSVSLTRSIVLSRKWDVTELFTFQGHAIVTRATTVVIDLGYS